MIIALNNKCNLTKDTFLAYQEDLAKITTTDHLILCPSFTNLALFNLTNVSLGAQNTSIDDQGAHTGEIAAQQLASFTVKYCIVGHSERRTTQHETNEDIAAKISQLFKNDITPILCVGESLEQRQNKSYPEIIKTEIIEATKSLTPPEKERLIIAYEPIWSIGTGLIPQNSEIMEVLTIIKNILPQSKILYGGSANDENIDTLKECPLIDGYLLGGLSLKIDNLQKFLKKLTH